MMGTAFLFVHVKYSDCGHKFYITRRLLKLEPMKRIPEDTRKRLSLIGALCSVRVAKKNIAMFGWTMDKMTIWRAV